MLLAGLAAFHFGATSFAQRAALVPGVAFIWPVFLQIAPRKVEDMN